MAQNFLAFVKRFGTAGGYGYLTIVFLTSTLSSPSSQDLLLNGFFFTLCMLAALYLWREAVRRPAADF